MNRRLTLTLLFFAMPLAAQSPLGKGMGSWWKQPSTVQQLNLTPEQQKKIGEVFQQFRVRLIDHTAALEREEVILEQLMEADPLDASKVRPEIDRVADARAQLEKANANMLLEMRTVLTKDQWETLKAKDNLSPKPRKLK
jgi:Spy/CpxP family protein refolding chaperone